MNQVEQWFSILQRKRLVAPNFHDLADLEAKILAFIAQWDETAQSFAWRRTSFDKVLAKVDSALQAAACGENGIRGGASDDKVLAKVGSALQAAA